MGMGERQQEEKYVRDTRIVCIMKLSLCLLSLLDEVLRLQENRVKSRQTFIDCKGSHLDHEKLTPF
jgi:hypothetical protein